MIRAHRLGKTFRTGTRWSRVGRVSAVDDVSFDVSAGEIVGLLGPNGAGKSTTMRMLTTLTRPTSGSAWIAGLDVATQPRHVRGVLGYVSQRGSASSESRVGEELLDHGMLHGLRRSEALASARALAARYRLEDLWDRAAGTLSGGQRRRLDIAMSLVHGPRVVVLDEPTVGLDPATRAGLWAHVRELRDTSGMTVLLSTHYLDEADALCDRLLVMSAGRLIADGPPDRIRRMWGPDTLVVAAPTEAVLARLTAVVEQATGQKAHESGLDISVPVPDGTGALADILSAIQRERLKVARVELRPPSLDRAFLELTGGTEAAP